MQDFDAYQKLALVTHKGPTGHLHMLTNAALGLTGEAGEVADLVKKQLYPSKPGDAAATFERIVDELGDVLWYVALAASAVGVPLSAVAQQNLTKLATRHGVIQDK